MEVTIFNAVFRKGLTEKEQFRKDLREVKELAFNIKLQSKSMLVMLQEASVMGRE